MKTIIIILAFISIGCGDKNKQSENNSEEKILFKTWQKSGVFLNLKEFDNYGHINNLEIYYKRLELSCFYNVEIYKDKLEDNKGLINIKEISYTNKEDGNVCESLLGSYIYNLQEITLELCAYDGCFNFTDELYHP